jgi:hypothetical protein
MNNEEFDNYFERKMEFFLHQQARFDADMQKLKEVHAETEQLAKQTAKNLAGLTGLVDDLARVTHDGFRFVFEIFKDTNAKFNALVDSQILTDEKLRELAATVDRHIREGHRGLNSA